MTFEWFVEALDMLDNLLRDTIGSKYAPQALSLCVYYQRPFGNP